MTPTAEKRFFYVETRAVWYRVQFEHQSLMRDSATAILCFDFVDLVVQGNNLYESINRLDDDWRKLVYTEVVPYEESFENRIKRLYEDWFDVSKKVSATYNLIESEYVGRGFDAAPIHDLRRAIREVEGMVVDDPQFFAGPELVTLRDAAIDDVRSGNVELLADSRQ